MGKSKMRVKRVKVHPAGALAVLNSAGVQGDIMRRAGAIAAAADKQSRANWGRRSGSRDMPGSRYAVRQAVRSGGKLAGRGIAVVETSNLLAFRECRQNNTLAKSLDAGR